MIHDAKSSYDFTSVKAYATLAAAASSQTSTVSREPYTSGSLFTIDVASVGTGGVLTVTLQNSPDDSTWTNATDDNTNLNDGNTIDNDVSLVISTVGVHTFAVPNPRYTYYRLNFAATVDDFAFSAIAISHRYDNSV